LIEGFIFIIVCEPERDKIPCEPERDKIPPYAKNRKVLHTVRIRWFAGVAAGCERERERENVVLVASYAACSILRVLTQWGATLVII
jgi:hypothetical protein